MSPCPKISRDSNDILRNCAPPLQINCTVHQHLLIGVRFWLNYLSEEHLIPRAKLRESESPIFRFVCNLHHSIKQLTFTNPLQAIPEVSKGGPKARYAASFNKTGLIILPNSSQIKLRTWVLNFLSDFRPDQKSMFFSLLTDV